MIKGIEDFYYNDGEEAHVEHDGDHDATFISYYKLNDNTNTRNAVLALYFSFTTLSTVGFGDFAPKSNFERIMGSIIMVFGVTLFSIIMGDFVQILNQFKSFDEEFSDESLYSFFSAIRHFNKNKNMNELFKKEIEAHFEFKWFNDRNIPLRT